ncbi:MAG: hypothetical protein QGH60_13525 [Phycisphaerae bacterium]|jgi:hypothetical protein|nr:hypothetical protein [Phycisphaerae bacterium]
MPQHKHNQFNKQRPKIKLTMLDRKSFGILELTFLTVTIKVRLQNRHVKILLALNDALHDDEGVNEEFLGFRKNKEIALAGAQAKFDYTPSILTVAAYRAQIHNAIRRAAPAGFQVPPLFETVRSGGVRLTGRIKVIDLSATRTA